MDQWSDRAESGGFYEGETPNSKAKPATRQQFLCPVTIRQLLEAPEDGLKVGSFTASMITVVGIVSNVEPSSMKIKFSLSDDTGSIDCIDWLESEDGEEQKPHVNIMENAYYQIFGCIKLSQSKKYVMVFKFSPIQDFNEYTAFVAEVLSMNHYAEKMNQMGDGDMAMDTSVMVNNHQTSNYSDNNGTTFTPIQKAVFDAIKAATSQMGWSINDPVLRSKFSSKQINDALEFLVGEGHIYSTIDDEHYSST